MIYGKKPFSITKQICLYGQIKTLDTGENQNLKMSCHFQKHEKKDVYLDVINNRKRGYIVMMYHVKIDEKKKQVLICRRDNTVFHLIMDVDVSKIKKSILKKEYDKKSILDLIKKIKKQ